MQTTLSYSNLYKDPGLWTVHTGPDINAVASDQVELSTVRSGALAGAMKVTYANKPAVGGAIPGALIALGLPPPIVNGKWLGYLLHSFSVWIGEEDLAELARFENDIKAASPGYVKGGATSTIAQIYDGSTQSNRDKGWGFQVDDANRHWSDTNVAGIVPVAGAWTRFDIRHFFDQARQQYQVLSAAVNGVVQPVTAGPGKLAVQQGNWGATLAVQHQAEGYASLEMYFDQGTLSCSDQPI